MQVANCRQDQAQAMSRPLQRPFAEHHQGAIKDIHFSGDRRRLHGQETKQEAPPNLRTPTATASGRAKVKNRFLKWGGGGGGYHYNCSSSNHKQIFLQRVRRPVFPTLFCQTPPPAHGGSQRGAGTWNPSGLGASVPVLRECRGQCGSPACSGAGGRTGLRAEYGGKVQR